MNKGVLLTALSALLYGSIGYFGTRVLEQGLPVSHMLFWRFLLASLLLAPFLLYYLPKQKIIFDKKALLAFIAIGGIFHASSTAFYFEASKTIGTGLGMVLFFTYPIFVVALSYFLKRTPISRATFLSLFLIICGSVMIALGSGIATNFDLRGIFLALLSGLGYGLYVYYSKEYNNFFSPLVATFFVCLGIAISFFVFILLGPKALHVPSSNDLWLLLFLFALFGTILPVLFLLAGMKFLSASTASIISVLEPVAVLAVGVILLEEPLEFVQFVGAIIILGATLLVYAKPQAERD